MNLKGLFIELVNLSLMGSILILVLLAIKPLLKRHISASAQYGLWFLVMARLILFAAPEHALSLNNLLAPMLSIFKHHPTVSQMSISTAPIERTDLALSLIHIS
ncbi:MAG: hypothetical protein N2376_04240, partial [Clostridia bacterium]|nr:hypothetical protein [Clostridia bacterium]